MHRFLCSHSRGLAPESWSFPVRCCWLVGLIWLAASAVLLSDLPPAAAAELFEDRVIAKGQSVQVRQSELDKAFIAYKANMAARKRKVPESLRTAREAQLLDRLIVTQVLVSRVTDTDRERAREAAARYLADTKKVAGSEEMFARHVKAMGLSMDQFNVTIMEQALADAVIDREVKSTVTVTDDQVLEFYETGRDLLVKNLEAHLARMRLSTNVDALDLEKAQARINRIKSENLERISDPEKVRVSHIFLSTLDRTTDVPLPDEQKRAKRSTMEKLLARARAGEDFQRLIDLFSEDRNIKETRGTYTVTRDSRFVQAFMSAAFSLQPGQISDVVTSELGYHILKLHEHIPAAKIEFKEAYPRVRAFLVEQGVQARLPDYFARVKKEAQVEILDPKYQVNFDNLDPLPSGS